MFTNIAYFRANSSGRGGIRLLCLEIWKNINYQTEILSNRSK